MMSDLALARSSLESASARRRSEDISDADISPASNPFQGTSSPFAQAGQLSPPTVPIPTVPMTIPSQGTSHYGLSRMWSGGKSILRRVSMESPRGVSMESPRDSHITSRPSISRTSTGCSDYGGWSPVAPRSMLEQLVENSPQAPMIIRKGKPFDALERSSLARGLAEFDPMYHMDMDRHST
jgi:hypothetical protein